MPSLKRSLAPAYVVGLLVVTSLVACGGDADSDNADEEGEARATPQDEVIVQDVEAAEREADPTVAPGAGSVFVNGSIWNFEADVCISQGSYLQVSGPGLRVDGEPFYVSIDVNSENDYDEDGTPDVTGTVTLEFGTDNLSDGAPEGEASYEATVLLVGDQLTVEEFEWELDGDYVTGSGQITDYHGVETDYGEYVAMEFTGGCL